MECLQIFLIRELLNCNLGWGDVLVLLKSDEHLNVGFCRGTEPLDHVSDLMLDLLICYKGSDLSCLASSISGKMNLNRHFR